MESAAPTKSESDDGFAQSVALLKTAAKTRKVPASEIIAAFKLLAKAKVDPTDFLPLIGGTKSPGRTWLLVFTCNKDEVLCLISRSSACTALQVIGIVSMFLLFVRLHDH